MTILELTLGAVQPHSVYILGAVKPHSVYLHPGVCQGAVDIQPNSVRETRNCRLKIEPRSMFTGGEGIFC
ncbi:hypothetical protein DPMN_099737 [Dreissena polymorpha]|uniref:Uncharacterized protein n=1 Tax=Dreissena polymorpha TaxID=45954 RepID=A0A9D4LEF9_DREPO|nr:hypothetical protein DPMN_099737 [Dreissena polymorpha]